MSKTFWGVLGALFVFFVVLPIGCTVIVADMAKTAGETVANDFKEAAATNASNKKNVASNLRTTGVQGGWSYRNDIDKMRGIQTRYASLSSENQLEFSFPYNGGSSGMITLREKGKSLNVMLSIDKGQFTCNSFNDETVAVKFDKQSIKKFRCVGAADGTTNVIFIENEKHFLSELRNSHHLIVEAEFFQQGRQQLEFDTSGLKW